jgi:hypothetical protein
MRYPERNDRPLVTSIATVGAALVFLFAAGAVFRISPDRLGRLAATLVMAGIVLGAWVSQASKSWSRSGYVWRFGAAWLVIVALGLVCARPAVF